MTNFLTKPFGAALIGAAALVATTAQAAPVISSDLVAFYDFNAGDSSDYTGVYGGTDHGGVSYTGGYAMFAGATGAAGIDTGIDIDTADLPVLTMGGWVLLDPSAGTYAKFLSHDDGGYDRTVGLDPRGGTGTPPAEFTAFTGSYVISDTANAYDSLGIWTHVAVSYSTSATTLYVNGAQVASGSVGTSESAKTLYIGSNPSYGAEDWIGGLDDIFVYSTVLSASQISDIYAAGITSAPAVPLPAGLPLLLGGLGGFAALRRRRKG